MSTFIRQDINISEIYSLIMELSPEDKNALLLQLGIPPDQLHDWLRDRLAATGQGGGDSEASYEEQLMGFASYRVSENLLIYIPPFLILIGTVGNILSFAILRRKEMIKYSTYFYLLVLAIADTLVLYVGLFRIWVGRLYGQDFRDYSDVTCKLTNVVASTVSDFSVWLIVAVTVDRYIVVCHPLKAQVMSSLNSARWVIIGLLVFLLGINLHFFWTVSLVNFTHKSKSVVVRKCAGGKDHEDLVENTWPWVDAVIYSLLPFVSLTVLNVLIIRMVVSSRQRRCLMVAVSQPTPSRETNSRSPIQKHAGAIYCRRFINKPSELSLSDNESSSVIANGILKHGGLRSGADRGSSSVGTGTGTVKFTCTLESETRTIVQSPVKRVSSSVSHELSNRLTIMLLIISIAFLLTTLPMIIVSIAAAFWNRYKLDLEVVAKFKLARTVTELLMYVNHSTNFFLYCATGQKFRRQLDWMVRSSCSPHGKCPVSLAGNNNATVCGVSSAVRRSSLTSFQSAACIANELLLDTHNVAKRNSSFLSLNTVAGMGGMGSSKRPRSDSAETTQTCNYGEEPIGDTQI